jgi:hypothetical protein
LPNQFKYIEISFNYKIKISKNLDDLTKTLQKQFM